jgi:hypothetical protein
VWIIHYIERYNVRLTRFRSGRWNSVADLENLKGGGALIGDRGDGSPQRDSGAEPLVEAWGEAVGLFRVHMQIWYVKFDKTIGLKLEKFYDSRTKRLLEENITKTANNIYIFMKT